MKLDTNIIPAIILARVSTEEQKAAGNSLPAQQARLISYIDRTPRLKLDKEFVFDESAYKEHRKEFEEVVDYITSSKGVVALCSDKVDRMTRDFLVGLPTLEKLRRDGKVELHFPSDNLVLHRESPATDLFHFNIAVSLAQYYSNAISDNVKRAFEKKRNNNEWTGPVRIGYKNVPLDKEKRLRSDIVIDQERAHLILKMFEMYATGNHSLETVRIEITKLGLRRVSTHTSIHVSFLGNFLKDVWIFVRGGVEAYVSFYRKTLFSRAFLVVKTAAVQCHRK